MKKGVIKKSDEKRAIYLEIDAQNVLQIPISDNFKHPTGEIPERENDKLEIEQRRKRYKLLTEREKEVFILLAKSHTNQVIANELSISVNTARTHRNRIYKKLDLTNSIDLLRFAEGIA